jgi:carotenoid cleavage dioxygenase
MIRPQGYGELPRELRGALFRIGPNPQFEPRDPATHHWFGATAWSTASTSRTARSVTATATSAPRSGNWSTSTAAPLFGSMGNPMTTDPLALGNEGGVANTNIVWHAGKLLALEEAHHPFAMDPHSLESLGYDREFKARSRPTRRSTR